MWHVTVMYSRQKCLLYGYLVLYHSGSGFCKAIAHAYSSLSFHYIAWCTVFILVMLISTTGHVTCVQAAT